MARLFRSLRKTFRNEIQYELQSSSPSNTISGTNLVLQASKNVISNEMHKQLKNADMIIAVKILFNDSPKEKKRANLLCTSAKSDNNKKNIITDERYKQLEDLDMMTAAKMLFTEPPKKKKFGFDFHLVQFFFACMPSLAVYLVAQYARYDMRKMEVEVEMKKKLRDEKEAEEKEKEMELNPPKVKESKSDLQLSEVKERLDKLEETVKEIAVVTKKQSSSNLDKSQVTDDEKKPLNSPASEHPSSSLASNKPIDVDRSGKHNSLKSKPESGEESKTSVANPNSSHKDPKG